MNWTIEFHPKVKNDIKAIGHASARRARKAIEDKLQTDPEKHGRPLRGNLHGWRKLRVGDLRIVYRIEKDRVVVLVLAIGQRSDEKVYHEAGQRVE